MSGRVHTAVPATRHASTGTAFPRPAVPVPSMAQWMADRHNRAPRLLRLFRKDRP